MIASLLILLSSLGAGPVATTPAPPAPPALEHLVPIGELDSALEARDSKREEDIAAIQCLLRHEAVRRDMGKLVDLPQLEQAVSSLDDQTLSRLANQSRKADDDLRAGMGKTTTIVIVIAAIVGGLAIALALADPSS